MLSHSLRAHRKRLRELADGRLTLGEAREDGSPGGIGERGEGGAELVDGHSIKPGGLIRIGARPDILRGTKGDSMGRIVVTEFVSLDGVMEDPG